MPSIVYASILHAITKGQLLASAVDQVAINLHPSDLTMTSRIMRVPQTHDLAMNLASQVRQHGLYRALQG